MQLSGIGPADLLNSLSIHVVIDLPGVGSHLADHLSSGLVYDTVNVEDTGDMLIDNATFAARQLDLWRQDNYRSMQNAPNNAVAYVNLTGFMTAAEAEQLTSLIADQKESQIAVYSDDTALQAGYRATYSAEQRDILPSPVGQIEVLMAFVHSSLTVFLS